MKKDYQFKLSQGNTKTGKTLTANLTARVTCNMDAPCARDGECYACQGRWLFKNVQKRLALNLKAWRENPATVVDEIREQISDYVQSGGEFFRWHSSGDIVDADYMIMMHDIAIDFPSIKFLCFTKKYDLVNDHIDRHGELPKNLKVLFSLWPDFPCNNPHNLPTASLVKYDGTVHEKHSRSGYACSGNCEACHICWKLESSEQVVFKQHGSKGKRKQSKKG